MPIRDVLRGWTEPLPGWLSDEKPQFDIQSFLASRVVIYPGSGTDGHPVKVFGSSSAAHCFVYADYLVTAETLKANLNSVGSGFRGYHSHARLDLTQSQLSSGWVQHIKPNERPNYSMARTAKSPFAFLEILQRDEGLDDAHGPWRLAILFVGADGVATYDALFCQKGQHSPFAAVLQDHGFGGNYTTFGAGGLLQRVAKRCNVWPEILLVANNTQVWPGYRPMGDASEAGGIGSHQRRLYRRAV